MREQFIDDVPAGLQPEALARWRHVWSCFEVDEAQYILVDLESGPGGCSLMRQTWSFDEEALQWELEANEEWWLPWGVSEALLRSLMEAMPRGQAK